MHISINRLALIFGFVFGFVSISDAQIEYGLNFRSYESSPSERTSLQIPESSIKIKFYESFSTSFEMMIDPKGEHFGYLCRFVIDEHEDVGILLTSPVNGISHLVATDSKSILVPLELNDILDWQTVEFRISFTDNKDSLSFQLYGDELLRIPCTKAKSHSIRILFGKNDMKGFETTDVAPLAIKNLSINVDEKHRYQWDLYGNNELSKYSSSRMDLSVQNPDWISDRYRKWRKISEIKCNGKIFHVIDKNRNIVYFIGGGIINKVTLSPNLKNEVFRYHEDLQPARITNDFHVLPDGTLAYVCVEGELQILTFDENESRWSGNVGLKKHSSFLHHTSFLNPIDSSIIQMFGYGFHLYLNDIFKISNSQTVTHETCNIPQRYLSASGLSGGKAWILGGKGNPTGIQELGVGIYNDLYTLNLRDYSVEYIRELDNPDSEVATSDLIVDEDSNTIIGLFYSPNTNNSRLQLKQYDIKDGSYCTLADEIPFSFIDIDSDASLSFDKTGNCYYACTVSKSDNGEYSGQIYMINGPILPPEVILVQSPKIRWHITIAAVMISSVLLLCYRRKKMREQNSKRYRLPLSTMKDNSPGIHLMGGFRVIDRDRNDISSEFTPMMRQLLSLLIIYSENQKSISNAEMKDILWADKSDDSYFNNRGVQIKNIRYSLAKVSDSIDIKSENGFWSISMNGELCDYCYSIRTLTGINNPDFEKDDVQIILTLTQKGPLLPETRNEWLDKFKSNYTEIATALLYKAIECSKTKNDPESRINLADNLLLFDSIDEEAIKAKCKALLELKRAGLANNIFNKFTENYMNLMGEKFDKSFSDFIKN